MIISEDVSENRYQIKGYKKGEIVVNEETYTKSLAVGLNQLIENWAPQTLEEVTEEHLGQLVTLHPELILLGTGDQFHLAPDRLLKPLIEKNIAVECMSTPAACRTFMALSTEGRNVVAALLIH